MICDGQVQQISEMMKKFNSGGKGQQKGEMKGRYEELQRLMEEERVQHKEEVGEMERQNQIMLEHLENENEYLKQQLENLSGQIQELHSRSVELENENEELRKVVQELGKELESKDEQHQHTYNQLSEAVKTLDKKRVEAEKLALLKNQLQQNHLEQQLLSQQPQQQQQQPV